MKFGMRYSYTLQMVIRVSQRRSSPPARVPRTQEFGTSGQQAQRIEHRRHEV